MSQDGAKHPQDEGQAEISVLRQALKDIVDPFKSLAHSPRALWGVYVSYLLEGLVYFGILTILGKYLSENVGLLDLHAGWVYSGFTGGITLAMLFLGGVADRIGVRRAMLLSMGLMVIGRALLGASGTFFPQGQGPGSPMFFAVILGLFVVVVGYGTYQPAAYSAIKRFTSQETASMGYAMIYGLMNLGAFFSGIISPPIRKSLGIESVFWVYTALTVIGFLVVLLVLTRKVVERDTLTNIDVEEDKGRAGGGDAASKPERPRLLTPTFIILIIAVIASTAMIAKMYVAGALPPERTKLMIASDKLDNVAAALSSATDEQTESVASLAAELESLSSGIKPPLNPAADGSVDVVRYELASELLAIDAEIVSAFGGLDRMQAIPAGVDLNRESYDAVRKWGIANMAAAYSLAGPVDDAVLDKLCSRMKVVGKAPIPLSEEDRRKILTLTAADPSRMLDGLEGFLEEIHSHLSQTAHPVLLSGLDLILRADTEAIEAMRRKVDAELQKGTVDLMIQRLVQSSTYLIRSVAPLISHGASGGNVPGGRGPSFTTADMMSSWVESEKAFLAVMSDSLADAISRPFSATLSAWAKRYGIWVLASVVFILLLGRNILIKRPEHPFHDGRFVFFIFILIPVQTLFAHNWLTLPYYIDRAFGGTTVGENFEFFSNLNPILIFFLAPMVAALTAKAKVYPMMIWGTLVMAAPTFLLALPPTPIFLLIYILLMSIGEAMWQPRFLQWVAEIAPEGQTGTYMGIGQFPWFLTKVLTGLYSGYFLARYCPIVGPQNTQFMWLIYSLIAMVSPIALIMAKGWMMKGMRTARQA